MTLGVAALIVVNSVMNGFEQQLQQRILQAVPHIFVEGITAAQLPQLSRQLQTADNVIGVAAYKQVEGMVSLNGQVAGAVISGIRPKSLGAVSTVPNSLLVGNFKPVQAGAFKVVIGAGMARQLGLYIGDKITLILPQVTITPAGIFPRTRRFTVVGIFEVGAQPDVSDIFIHYDDLHRLLKRPQGEHGLRLAVADVLQAGSVRQQLQQQLPPSLRLQDWSGSHGSLFQAIKVEKLMVALLLAIIIAIAAFNVVAVLTILVINKRAAIAVMLTMGASPRFIARVFIAMGLLLGVAGTLLGLAFGLPIALYLDAIMAVLEQLFGLTVFDADVYYISRLPSDVRFEHVAYVVLLALVLSMAATIYPARRAGFVHPSEVLRYE